MKRLLIICPSRIRPDRIQTMLKSFDETKSEGTDIVIYVSKCDPRLEEYKANLKDRNLIIGERLPISHVYNYCSSRYPEYKYYGEVCDDHVYRTQGWDDILIKEIESHGGWGMSWGWGQIHPREVRLPQAAIISGNIVHSLGFFSTPIITSAYNDRFAIDLFDALGCAYYRPDVIIEHQHVLNDKAKMDANYAWVLSQETLETGKKQYEEWRNFHMNEDIERVRRRMGKKIGALIKCYHNTDYLKAVLRNYAWVDRIVLQNYRFPSVKETTDDTEEIALNMGLKNLEFYKDNTNILQQHELSNRAVETLNDFDFVFFADADELMLRADQEKLIETLIKTKCNSGSVRIKDYCIDLNHQLPPRDKIYENNWCMVIFNPQSTRFTRLRQTIPTTLWKYPDITMHHFGFVFPEERLKWKIAWEANEEKIKEGQIWEAVNNRRECEPPPQEILDYIYG